MDPDFGVKTTLRMATSKNQRNKCRIKTEVGSEIPELGLDKGRVNLDCQLNPVRMANAAARVARNYAKLKRQRQRQKQQQASKNNSHRPSDSQVKHKRTRLSIDHDSYNGNYQQGRANSDDDDRDED